MSQTNAPTEPTVPLDALNAWLEYVLQDYIERRDEVMAALNRQQDQHQTISDESTSEAFAFNRKLAETLVKDIEIFHDTTKAPWLAGGRAIDGAQKSIVGSLRPVLDAHKRLMDEYLNNKVEIERQKAEEHARAARQVAERAAEAAAREMAGARVPERAEAALKVAQNAAMAAQAAEERARGKAADLVRSKSPYGPTTTMTERWTYEVTDFSLVPDELKIINIAAVGQKIRDRTPGGIPRAKIPGIRWVKVQSSSVRG